MPSFLRLAVFDVDGTLVDSQHNIVAAMSAACRAHACTVPPPHAIRGIIGLALVEAVAALLPGIGPDMHHRVAETYKEAFFELRARPNFEEPLFPGAGQALALLEEAGWLLGIATGKSTRGALAMIERHGLQGRFVTIQTADDNPGKPDPAMLLRAMAEAGAKPAATVMLGDTSFDMLMARHADVGALGVGWGYHTPDELREAGALAIVEDYADVPAGMARLIKERACGSVRS